MSISRGLLVAMLCVGSAMAIPARAGSPELARKRVSPFDPRGEAHIPIGVVNSLDTLKTFVESEGDFSPGVGSYGVYYWVRDEKSKTLVAPTFDGVKVEHGLTPEGYLIAWSTWRAGEIDVRTEVCEVQRPSPAGSVLLTGARATLKNATSGSRKVTLMVALRPLGPAGFPVRSLAVSPEGDALVAEGHPAIVAKSQPTAAGVLSTDTIGERLAEGRMPTERTAASDVGSCSGVLCFDFELAAGESKTIELVCSVLPGRRAARHQWDDNPWFKLDQAELNPKEGGILQPDPGLDFDRAIAVSSLFEQAHSDWSQRIGPPRIVVPDPRWEQARVAIMSHLAMVLNEGAPDLAVVNLSVFNRDAVYMANALQKSGMFDLAEVYIDDFLKHPFQGRVQPEADNPGQILWILAEHWKLTRDRAWLERVSPAIPKLVALIRYVRTTPGPHWVWDDTLEFGDALPSDRRKDLKPGACDGFNPAYTEAFDISGLRAAAMLARELGHDPDAVEWTALAGSYAASYDQSFGADLGKGYGSYAVLWPCRLYPLDAGQAHERFLGIGAKNTGEWRYFPLATAHQGLYAGNRSSGHGTIASHLADPQMVGWYAFDEGGPSGVGGWPGLLSTWSCNYPPEPRPDWARVSGRAMPDGWGLAEFWLLMRDSLLFEDGDRLALLGGVAPEWFHQDMAVKELPTWFGAASFRYQTAEKGAVLTLDGPARPPGGFVLRLPHSPKTHVIVDGRSIEPASNGDFLLPTRTTRAEIVFAGE